MMSTMQDGDDGHEGRGGDDGIHLDPQTGGGMGFVKLPCNTQTDEFEFEVQRPATESKLQLPHPMLTPAVTTNQLQVGATK